MKNSAEEKNFSLTFLLATKNNSGTERSSNSSSLIPILQRLFPTLRVSPAVLKKYS